MEERHGQQTIKYIQPGSQLAFNISQLLRRQRKRRALLRDAYLDSKGNIYL